MDEIQVKAKQMDVRNTKYMDETWRKQNDKWAELGLAMCRRIYPNANI